MNTKTITTTITKAISLILIIVISVACENDRGMMHGSVTIGNNPWNWGQILISLAIGIVVGFFLGLAASRMKK
ncbi:MAG: hypothetical protein D4R67_05490 [Bacteroidetes bacterium]|nr:MAG: hypothetical protein D4R67_05490 [Bacteroidota bacterium]